MDLTEPQKVSMVTASTISSCVSIVGSVSILIVLFRFQNRLSTTYRRLMCGIAVTDLLYSLAWVLGDLPAPRGTPGTLFAYGNTGLCTAQGLISFVGHIASALYISSLSLYYLLTITGYSSMHDQNVNLKLEIVLHAVPILWATVTGLYMAFAGSLNFSGQTCWIAPEPVDCIHKDNVECIRGERAYDHRWWFSGYPLFVCFGFIVICMVYLIHNVIRQWANTEQYERRSVIEHHRRASTPAVGVLNEEEERRGSTTLAVEESPVLPAASTTLSTQSPVGGTLTSATFLSRQQRRHRPEDVTETVNQALLYIGGFMLTYSIPGISMIIRQMTGKTIFVLYLIANFLSPLQGFINFFIFIRPRMVLLRHSHPTMPFSRLLWKAIVSRAETSALSRRRGSARLSIANRPRRGYTARELHMQQQANNAEANAQQDGENDGTNDDFLADDILPAPNQTTIVLDDSLNASKVVVDDNNNSNSNKDVGFYHSYSAQTSEISQVRSGDGSDTQLGQDSEISYFDIENQVMNKEDRDENEENLQ